MRRMINGEKLTLTSNCYEKTIDIVTDVEYAKKIVFVWVERYRL